MGRSALRALPVECGVVDPGQTLIEPVPAAWSALIAAHKPDARRLGEPASTFREQIGLPPGDTLIMSGHQPGFWHPGIVAKYAAVQAGESLGASVWLVADLDAHAPTRVRLPRRGDEGVVRVEAFDSGSEDAGDEH